MNVYCYAIRGVMRSLFLLGANASQQKKGGYLKLRNYRVYPALNYSRCESPLRSVTFRAREWCVPKSYD